VLIDNVALLRATAPGDFNADGQIDGADLAVWRASFAANGDADADGDGDSDGADFLTWQRQVGAAAAASAGIRTPEPASLVGALVGAVCCAAFGKTLHAPPVRQAGPAEAAAANARP
jgi:hypothetical protein